MTALKKVVILSRLQSNRLEGRTALVQRSRRLGDA
jgi:hypothetical protein